MTVFTHRRPNNIFTAAASHLVWFSQRVIDNQLPAPVANIYTKLICKVTPRTHCKPLDNPHFFKKGTIRNGYIIKMVKVPCRSGKRKAWRRLQ